MAGNEHYIILNLHKGVAPRDQPDPAGKCIGLNAVAVCSIFNVDCDSNVRLLFSHIINIQTRE